MTLVKLTGMGDDRSDSLHHAIALTKYIVIVKMGRFL